jgi:RNA polymerase sigma factor (sigma-70 family)
MADTPTDIALLRLARSGDRTALRELIVHHLDWLRSRVRRRLGDGLRRELDSEDVVQDIVASLLAAGRPAEFHDIDHFRALLIRVVDTDLRDRIRWSLRERRNRAREERVATDGSSLAGVPIESVTRPSQHFEQKERLDWIRAGMAGLHPDDQRLLRRRIWQEQSFRTIAEELDVTEDAARMRVNRALARLARVVAALRGAPGGPASEA